MVDAGLPGRDEGDQRRSQQYERSRKRIGDRLRHLWRFAETFLPRVSLLPVRGAGSGVLRRTRVLQKNPVAQLSGGLRTQSGRTAGTLRTGAERKQRQAAGECTATCRGWSNSSHYAAASFERGEGDRNAHGRSRSRVSRNGY